MRFFCVNDGVPEITTRLLREACEQQMVRLPRGNAAGSGRSAVPPGGFDRGHEGRAVAVRVVRFKGPFLYVSNATLVHERRGLPVPRNYAVTTSDRTALRQFAEAVGGFPAILKVPGGSGGIGVMRVDSLPGLYSMVDHLASQGTVPNLMAYVDNAIHWRLIVAGDQVIASYRNTPEKDDFRTYAGEEMHDYTTPPPGAMREIAVDSAKVLRLEFAGVDLLEHPSGRIYLLESNFPCYFAQAQQVAGVDVAGAMIEHLAAKGRRILEQIQAFSVA